MKILIVGDFIHEMYEIAMYDAFIEQGIEVDIFILKRYSGKNPIFNFINKFQNRLLLGKAITSLNSELIDRVKEQHPDLVFLYRTPQIFGKTVLKIKKIGSKVFSYNNDDPFSGVPTLRYWRHYQNAIKYCDYNFVYRKKNLFDFKKLNIENVSILRSYYIKKNNYIIDCQKDIDVVFIGHFENDGRDKHIKALKDSGVNIIVYGDVMWKNAPLYNDIKSVLRDSKRGKEYNETMNRAKISIVFLSKINNDTYTRRCFEIPATKTLMLSEYTDDLNGMFEADKEAVYFKNSEELVSKCKYLLEHEDLIKEIAENGYQKLRKTGHEVTNRAHEILKVYSQLMKKI